MGLQARLQERSEHNVRHDFFDKPGVVERPSTWEYRVLQVSEGDMISGKVERDFDDLGRMGWELVHISERTNKVNHTIVFVAFFKRPGKGS